jgi:hypothetical protein
LKIFELFGSVLIENNGANKSLDETESKAKKLTEGLSKAIEVSAKVGAAVVGGFTIAGAAIMGMADKTSESMDRIDKMSQRLGMTKQSFQEWDYILSQNGVSMDSMNTAMKSMTTAMASLSVEGKKGEETLGKLGISVEDLKNMSQEQIFEKAVVALQNMNEGYEKARLAQQLFGKQGQEMLPMLNQSKGSIDELKNKARELGLVMSDSAVNSGVKYKDTMDSLKRSIEAVKTTIGVEFIPTAQKMADSFINNMPKIRESVTGFVKIATPVLEVLGATILFVAEHLETLTAVAAFALYTFLSYKAIAGIFFIFDNLAKITAFLTATKAALAATNLALSGSFVALGGSLLTVLPYILMVVAALGALYGIVQLVKGGSKLDMGGTLTTDLSKFTQGSTSPMQSSPTTTNRNSTNNYNVNVSAKDVKEFSDMAEFFNSVPRLSRGY